MCVVSAVMDYGRDQWPGMVPGTPWVNPMTPTPALAPNFDDLIKKIDFGGFKKSDVDAAREEGRQLGLAEAEAGGRLPTKDEIEAFLKLVQAAEEFDKRANQPHCEDPEKIKLLAALEARLKAMEEKIDRLTGEQPQSLYGSSNLPAYIQIGDRQVQLGEVVQRAFKDSGLSPDDWNELTERQREHRLTDAIADMREEVQ